MTGWNARVPGKTAQLLRSPSMLSVSLTLKHVDGRLRVVSHGVHEDEREELGEDDADLGAHQLVCDHLGEESCRLLAYGRVLGVAEHVEEVDEGACRG